MADTALPILHPADAGTERVVSPSLGPATLQHLFDHLPNAILCLDRSWRITYANTEAMAISRLTAADLNSKTHWQLYPETVGQPLEALYRQVMATRVAGHIEYHHAPFSVWLDIHIIPIEGGIALHYSNITDRKLAEALRDLNASKLQQVFEATTDGVISLSRDWTITFTNQQANDVLGRNDLVGLNLWEEFPLAVHTDFYRRYHETMLHRTPCQFEEFYPGSLDVWFSIQCRPSDDGIVVFFRDITAERAARQDLLDHKATLAFVKQTARVATWVIDFANEAMTIGEGSYPVFGRPNEEITTLKDFRDLVHPEDRETLRANTARAIDTRTATYIDFRAITPDGTVLWLEGRGMAVYNSQGDATHLRGMTTDITIRKQNEEHLAASEARYRVLADLNPQAIWIGSPEGRILYANQGFLDYTGQTLANIAGLGWLEPFDPLDRDRVVAAWSHSIATGDEYLIDARLVRSTDRASRWWTLRALPVRNDAGVIQQWLGVAYDIHDLRTTAETLREKQQETERQRAELETVYRTAPVGLGLFDPTDFRYLRLNDRLAEIIGKPIDQILGHTISEIAPPAARQILEQVVAERTIQRRVIEGEFPGRPGELHHFNINYAPIFASDGSIQAIASATLDITHQKKAETALIQSEKLAAVGRLASSISHEINNPLEAITNLLFLIALDDNLPDPVKLYVNMAQSELGRVSQIVTQTLRFHRQAVNPTEVTAAELVNAVLNLYQGRLANSAIRIEADYVSSTRILCFENDIRQVLNNLIANAIDAMRSGGRLVIRAHDISAAIAPGGRPGVRITIADTGHGMSPDVARRIYEPFFTTKDLNGTGLGLWISAGIVGHHNGRLNVRSTQQPTHHGTVFALFLPLRSSEDTPSLKPLE